MQILILISVFICFTNLYAENTVYENFITNLKSLSESSLGVYNNRMQKKGRSELNRKALENYLNSHNPILRNGYKNISSLLNSSTPYFQKIINRHIKDNPPLSAAKIHDFFQNISPVNFSTGDIIMVLPATSHAISFAYLSSSAYEHLDLIIIGENNIPYVLELSRHSDFSLIPLATYLTGSGAPLTRFAIYRSRQTMKTENISEIINLLKPKVVYDPLYKIDFKDSMEFRNKEFIFMYCSEFVYTVYKTLFNTDFGWEHFISWLEMSTRADKDIHSFVSAIYEKKLLSDKDGIIRPEFFSESDLFYKVVSMGPEDKIS